MRLVSDAAPSSLALPASFPATDDASPAARLLRAAGTLLACLERGAALDARTLREAMTQAFGATDSEGAWLWKDAYEACEVALLLFLRRHFPAMRARAGSHASVLGMLARLAALTPTHTRRSEESQQLQQFSTPIELGFVAALAAGIMPADRLLEPSAGTGQLAIFAELHGATLALNEIAPTRADLLARLFPGAPVTRFDAESIHDYLPGDVHPSVILMNPPFSAALHVNGRTAGTDFRHLRSALHRLAPGGRLVAITGANLSSTHPEYQGAFEALNDLGRVVFTVPISGALYRRHGTAIETRLTVIDRVPASDMPGELPAHPMAESAEALLDLVTAHVPARTVMTPAPTPPSSAPASSRKASLFPFPAPVSGSNQVLAVPSPAEPAIELTYICVDEAGPPAAAPSGDAIYEPYRVETICIGGAHPHPTRLVQSAAMASVKPPKPSYRPHLPERVVAEGLLSDAQLESVIYAGEAHCGHLAGRWKVNESLDRMAAARDDDISAVRFRRGWFLGDGTGAGKGRQVAGILLDNWLKGRRRALWVSKSDKLIEDAQRDWTALGQEKLRIVPQSRFRQGKPITLNEGILFTTYATLRSSEREGKASRLTQIVDWLGAVPGGANGFDGVIMFDESHAMANAAGDKTERGDRAASQQGLAGLRLQHALPDARIVYVSATGATTVENLAYTQRLGLWGADAGPESGSAANDSAETPPRAEAGAPFATRAQFVAAMQHGGIAAMEVLARDLKALGLYAARSLSYEGVEVEMLEHNLTPEQIRIYDAYAGAFQVIHQNLDAALRAANITGDAGTLNRQAKAAACSAFESNKQRFFNHLITAMKCPTLIRAIEADLAEGRAAVVQLVSTSEALMERRLAQIPAGEWGDLSVDVTPREYVLDYLAHSFPTQLHEPYTDDNGNLLSRPVFVDGQPVPSKEAEARRDRLIEHLAALPPVAGALDQLLHHFGTDHVAEVTGRGRRIVRKPRAGGFVLAVENRAPSANLAETQGFMDGRKNVLVFSDAGGTGRSYHADLAARNQRKRVHYLLEAGWKADAAIQGLGRTNRTNQKQPPLFRPVATDVRGEKRFLSTIARRLDSLGAITRGQRQTGGQGLFRAEDNLESPYARSALRRLYQRLYRGAVACCSLERFSEVTGLNLLDGDGSLREDLPPITTFLNRLLALEIGLQNAIFAEFEELLASQIESAIAAGTYEVGLETIRAESLAVVERRTIATHATGAETRLYQIARKERNQPLTLREAVELARGGDRILLANTQSHRAAVQAQAPSITLDDGTIERRVRLIRPMERQNIAAAALSETHWKITDVATFSELWTREVETVPEFTESRFHLATGLLLPIWKQLPRDNPRVYRFQTDDGERVIGRLIPPEFVDAFTSRDKPLTAEEAWQALHEGRSLPLAGGLALRRVTVMHAARIELMGFDADDVPGLKAKGLIGEIISWKLRLFVPINEEGLVILGKLLHSHPVIAMAAPET
jgi:hypothetical protein